MSYCMIKYGSTVSFETTATREPPASPLRLDWTRLTECLTDIEECIPDGIYLTICTLLKHIYPADTLEEQRSYLRELQVLLESMQWSYLVDPLAC